MNPSRIILWLVGCISHEKRAALPTQPGFDSIIHRLDHSAADDYAYHPIYILSEFCCMGRLGQRIIPRLHRCGNMDEAEERVKWGSDVFVEEDRIKKAKTDRVFAFCVLEMSY